MVNTPEVPGRSIECSLGLVTGTIVHSKHLGRDIMAGLKSFVGGEIVGYTQMMQEARNTAINRMVENAVQCGANAIVNIRFTTSSIAQGMSEFMVFGTAVKLKDRQKE